MSRIHVRALAFAFAAALAAGGAAASADVEFDHPQIVVYYQDAARTVEIGREGLECDRQTFATGARSAYSVRIDLECLEPIDPVDADAF